MEEGLAPEAEAVYRRHNLRGGMRDTYVVVRVLDGTGVIEQEFVGDKTLAEVAREAAR